MQQQCDDEDCNDDTAEVSFLLQTNRSSGGHRSVTVFFMAEYKTGRERFRPQAQTFLGLWESSAAVRGVRRALRFITPHTLSYTSLD